MKVSNVASVRKIVAAIVVGGLVFIGFDAVIRGAKHNNDALSSKTGDEQLQFCKSEAETATEKHTGKDGSFGNISSRSSEDILKKPMVVLGAISSNHYAEAQKMFSTVQNCLPETKIIVYDIGLRESERNVLTKRKNFEVRLFPFDKYKDQPQVKRLKTCSFKPIIVKQICLEYPDHVILYGDSSVRMLSCNLTSALQHLQKFPFLSGAPIYDRVIQFTHDGMIKYLGFPKTRKEMANVQTIQGGSFLLHVTNEAIQKIIDPWEDCATHTECIAPAGSKRFPCSPVGVCDGHFVGCHRYDQSAINLVLAREYGMDYHTKAVDRSISDKLFIIERNP